MSYKMHPGTLYDYHCGVACGVLLKESTMRKLAKLQAAHLEAVKRLLSDEADRGNVFPSAWTLHYPEGEQTEVYFESTASHGTVEKAIRYATTAYPPRARFPVFIAKSMEEAKVMADARHQELREAETEGEK